MKNVVKKSFLASILYDISVEVDEILMGRAEKLQVVKRKVEFELTSKRHVSEGPDRFIANKCAIKVAEEGNLSLDRRGDIEMFCKTMGCSWRYAKKILYHIQEGTTESLLVRDSRKDVIKATEWPMKLAQFV